MQVQNKLQRTFKVMLQEQLVPLLSFWLLVQLAFALAKHLITSLNWLDLLSFSSPSARKNVHQNIYLSLYKI